MTVKLGNSFPIAQQVPTARIGSGTMSKADEERWNAVMAKAERLRAAGFDEVERLCKRLGYGFVMHEASRAWRMNAEVGGTGMMVGPHRSSVVKCPCPDADPHCDWCCGAGWVTKRVLEAMEQGR